MKVITVYKLSKHLIWVFGLLEMITVPLVAWLPSISSLAAKSPVQGAVVGFAGVVILFFILNCILRKLRFGMEGERVTKISILPAAVWNTLLLALIFGIQKICGIVVINSWIPRYVLAGFVSVFGAVFITVTLYRWVSRYIPCLRLSFRTAQHGYTVKKIDVLNLSLTAGIYEAIALPFILLWLLADSLVPVVAGLTGLAGGLLGAGAVVVLFNNTRLLHFSITLEEHS